MLDWFIWMHVIALWPIWFYLTILALSVIAVIFDKLLEGR